jgi:murein tripeptide amidase MpaA
MRAYGNMSAAEKAMNKDDLIAYKHNINKNYALIPGIQTTVEINDIKT